MSKKTVEDKGIELKGDVLLKLFWKDKERFADLFNTCLFGGETVIHPEELIERDSADAELVIGDTWIESVERIRDVIKMSALGTDFVLLGIENQDKIHYAMPLRTMVYDAIGYAKQCKEIAKEVERVAKDGKNKKNKGNIEKEENATNIKITRDEYLGRFRKTDKLMGQYTIVIYYGEQEWDGPKSLKEMLRMPKQIEPFVQDYRMNLLEARKIDYSKFATEDVMALFHLLHISSKKENILQEQVGFEVTSEVLLLAGEVCNVKKWTELALEQKGESISVCKAWDEALEEVKTEMREEVKAEVKEEVKAEVKEEVKEEVKAEVTKKVTEDNIKSTIELLVEDGTSIESAFLRISKKFNMTIEAIRSIWEIESNRETV